MISTGRGHLFWRPAARAIALQLLFESWRQVTVFLGLARWHTLALAVLEVIGAHILAVLLAKLVLFGAAVFVAFILRILLIVALGLAITLRQ